MIFLGKEADVGVNGGARQSQKKREAQKRMAKALSSTSLLSPSGGLEILIYRWVFVVDVTKQVVSVTKSTGFAT